MNGRHLQIQRVKRELWKNSQNASPCNDQSLVCLFRLGDCFELCEWRRETRECLVCSGDEAG